MRQPQFITFEGGEGSGKSTRAKQLADSLRNQGFEVVLTREPGGSPVAEKLRAFVVNETADPIDPLTEALIIMAARADHWNKIIRPSLAAGKIVICDRFHDSSLVYQGACQGVSVALLNKIYNAITGGRWPDLTYIIDVDPRIGLRRALARSGDETRFEHKSMAYHNAVRAAYLKLAQTHPRYKIIKT